MAGIYIHIPFCKQACHYCNFHFVTSLHHKPGLVKALIKEIDLQKRYLHGEPVETIYLGGGTPSLLNIEDLTLIITKLTATFPVSLQAEITLEANPDDITEERLVEWQQAGINRLSIGIQSFFDEDLQWMNRAHDSKLAVSSLQLAVKYFKNITVDLIYGTPYLTHEKWKHNVDTVVALNIPHLSCYALTVEPKTPLHKMISQHKTEDIDPDKQSEQFLLLMQWLDEAGYEHYEISNFAKPGYRSRHNSSYWQGKNYVGIGPSAHSFNGESRQWNTSNNTLYIDSINSGDIPCEKEVLTPAQKLNEYIMTSLRTMEGIGLDQLYNRFGIEKRVITGKAKKFIDTGLIEPTGISLTLTRQGRLLADGIAAELFF